jgi:hypothetical protein
MAGCGEDLRTLRGKVSWQGEPVERGEISLVPADRSLPPRGASVTGGTFTLQAPPGLYTVQVRGSRPLPPEQQTPGEGPLYEDFIPSRHHSESTLQIEIPLDKPELILDLQP